MMAGLSSGLMLWLLQLRALQQHALTLSTAQLFPWTKTSDVCAKEFWGALDPQVTTSITTCISQYFLPFPHSPENYGILTPVWGCLLLANVEFPTCKNISQGCPLELFGEQTSGVMEKAIYMPQTLLQNSFICAIGPCWDWPYVMSPSFLSHHNLLSLLLSYFSLP